VSFAWCLPWQEDEKKTMNTRLFTGGHFWATWAGERGHVIVMSDDVASGLWNELSNVHRI
jgi:hypothetical protein